MRRTKRSSVSSHGWRGEVKKMTVLMEFWCDTFTDVFQWIDDLRKGAVMNPLRRYHCRDTTVRTM